MKYLRLCSDIHLDHQFAKVGGDITKLWFPVPMEGDDETCLIIAGDMWYDFLHLTMDNSEASDSWMDIVARQFKYVITVSGNHDFWTRGMSGVDNYFTTHDDQMKMILADRHLDNVFHLAKGEKIELDGLNFMGGTLWTDFCRRDPLVMEQARQYMNDYRLILTNSMAKLGHKMARKVHPIEVYDEFVRTWDVLKENMKTPGRNIIVTHMAPSVESIHYNYRNPWDMSNFFYFSELTEHIFDLQPELWVHGHVHHTHKYKIGDTQIAVNAHGYKGEGGIVKFEERWRYDLDTKEISY